MQSEEEILERTNRVDTDTIGTEKNIEETSKDDEILGSKPKRKKKSAIWSDFTEIKDADGVMKISCIHCKKMYRKTKITPTTQLHRHLQSCAIKAKADKSKDGLSQTQLGFVTSSVDPTLCSSLYVGKFDMEKMKESVAHWIMMHEHPFSIVEEEGFNLMQRREMPEWRGITRNTSKTYCINVYEAEKKQLKSFLKNVNKISLTTDCWKSKNQKIEYMVITGHWIDESWHSVYLTLFTFHLHVEALKLQMSFGAAWRIGASMIYVRNKRRLLCEGKLFHVRCCGHILNLIAQDGLSEIKNIVDVIRDSVEYVRRSDARLKIFSEIVKQLNLPDKKLVDDCRTRWNSTYEMLAAAIKFKDVFPRFADREPHYDICLSAEDWTKAEKVCSILELFWTVAHIVSGSDYPTSNLFLNEVSRVKVLLDKKSLENDIFIQDMVARMKKKFDKYW
ncbi:zinc finger BED domain-containing protein RICESLEEPER 2-like [Sesamum indicum]|uniref:Zinc finger BED domain-containing protein RICESLEEPER 2-like n=1 Tax=Sesamum indicum TaxID=4182 RepID=A0A8M8V116_SESIN|nr:zinc finger BED domain-containing protein RICESLEEPER 2-like [Sesamum indicum]